MTSLSTRPSFDLVEVEWIFFAAKNIETSEVLTADIGVTMSVRLVGGTDAEL